MEISNPKNIQISDFNYCLPDERIAKYPLEERDASKLLVCRGGQITDSQFRNLSNFLPQDTLLVFNNTKVIQARMHFQKATGAQIEIFCLEPCSPSDYLLSFQQTQTCSWYCMVGNLKKWKEGALNRKIVASDGRECTLEAVLEHSEQGTNLICFSWDNPNFCFSDLLELAGELPIPPYLNRDTEEKDKTTYQTIYSKIEGSVAAPTAGLHFTKRVFDNLSKNSVKTAEVTLHVGAGTFKPVKSELIKDHDMHTEFISVTKAFVEALMNHNGKVIAVGTTSVRTLESLYYIGEMIGNDFNCKLQVQQWQPYEPGTGAITKQQALLNISNYMERNQLKVLTADTRIIIVPGYEFKIVDGIITNFHQPQSTLLLLISAVLGDSISWKTLYDHALANGYRFLSYGDSSLLMRN